MKYPTTRIRGIIGDLDKVIDDLVIAKSKTPEVSTMMDIESIICSVADCASQLANIVGTLNEYERFGR